MSDPNESNRRIAALALAMDSTAPSSARPDLLEIDLWRQGQLEEPRASEVMQWLTRDSACNSLLRQLENTDQALAGEAVASAAGVLAEREVASLSLALSGSALKGKRPDLLEIDLWRQGQLEASRASEVSAFIELDPICQGQLASLQQADQRLAEELAEAESAAESVLQPQPQPQPQLQLQQQPGLIQRLRDWLVDSGYRSGMVAGTAATIVAVMLTLNTTGSSDLDAQLNSAYHPYSGLPSASRWLWQQQATDYKAVGQWQDPAQPARQAFRIGLRQGLEALNQPGSDWLPIINSLPVSSACQHSNGLCSKESQRLHRQLGRLSLLQQVQCMKKDTVSLSATDGLRQSLQQQLAGLQPISPFSQRLARWNSDPDQACSQVAQLINQGVVP
ncbi:MAG: hypothetical protein OIF57_18285 [Marinobacterium sp.]|nr:hypothetical protein [Marinobacterium sp.]